MQRENRATRIEVASFESSQMRAFHLSWFAFFLCAFGWFGVAPMMAIIRDELQLTKTQIGNTIIASVAITIVCRLVIGWLCDRIGPRRAYAGLLLLGAIPVAAIGLAESYEGFLFARLCIGAVGAGFVITQYHTSRMFAPNVVGAANATTAGWGNMGGGFAQLAMPLLFSAVMWLGVDQFLGWRLAMLVPAVLMGITAVLYLTLTQDTPDGDFREVQKAGGAQKAGSFLEVCRDGRVWTLCVIYGACFGVELTINNIAALYFHDYFELSVATAGLVASLFGLMNLFARSLGGMFGDRAGIRWGLKGRAYFLGAALFVEGCALVLFSQMTLLPLAIATLIVFSLFVQMSSGATFSLVPMINRRALGSVAGIVGAGGNAGAVVAGFIFRAEGIDTPTGLFYLGFGVLGVSGLSLLMRFSAEQESEARAEIVRSLESGTPTVAE